jgi:hypothetical protein
MEAGERLGQIRHQSLAVLVAPVDQGLDRSVFCIFGMCCAVPGLPIGATPAGA